MFLVTYLFIELSMIIKTFHHQLIHQNLKLKQSSTGRKLEVPVSHFGPMGSLDEVAFQNCCVKEVKIFYL